MDSTSARPGQGGFTLTELVAVITVVGILAASALPKVTGLNHDARVAVLHAAEGALASTAAMVHGKYLVDPGAWRDGAVLQVEDARLIFRHGYPLADAGLAAAAGLDRPGKFTVSRDGATLRFSPEGVADPANCHVRYSEAASAGTAPVIQASAGDCG
jgi:MSHA pilin protein MshA